MKKVADQEEILYKEEVIVYFKGFEEETEVTFSKDTSVFILGFFRPCRFLCLRRKIVLSPNLAAAGIICSYFTKRKTKNTKTKRVFERMAGFKNQKLV